MAKTHNKIGKNLTKIKMEMIKLIQNLKMANTSKNTS